MEWSVQDGAQGTWNSTASIGACSAKYFNPSSNFCGDIMLCGCGVCDLLCKLFNLKYKLSCLLPCRLVVPNTPIGGVRGVASANVGQDLLFSHEHGFE